MRSLLLAAALATLQAAAPSPEAAAFRVIVHPDVKGARVTRQSLADIFLKKTPRWADGSSIEPVDRSLTSTLRAAFCRQVMGQSPAEAQIYWTKAMHEGRRPPPVKGSDEEVLAFVAATRGAIGYVSPNRALPTTVKALEIQ